MNTMLDFLTVAIVAYVAGWFAGKHYVYKRFRVIRDGISKSWEENRAAS